MTTEETMQETVEERLAKLDAKLDAIMSELEILTKAPTTPKEIMILEKLQEGRKSLTVRDAIHFAHCSRHTALDAMRNIADKEPNKYLFRLGDVSTKRASVLIVRAVQAKPIDFASACAGKTEVHLNPLAKAAGLELSEAYRQANTFREATNKLWILQERKNEQVFLVKDKTKV